METNKLIKSLVDSITNMAAEESLRYSVTIQKAMDTLVDQMTETTDPEELSRQAYALSCLKQLRDTCLSIESNAKEVNDEGE